MQLNGLWHAKDIIHVSLTAGTKQDPFNPPASQSKLTENPAFPFLCNSPQSRIAHFCRADATEASLYPSIEGQRFQVRFSPPNEERTRGVLFVKKNLLLEHMPFTNVRNSKVSLSSLTSMPYCMLYFRLCWSMALHLKAPVSRQRIPFLFYHDCSCSSPLILLLLSIQLFKQKGLPLQHAISGSPSNNHKN